MKRFCAMVAGGLMVGWCGAAQAETLAHWRFEEGAADAEFAPPPTNGGDPSGRAADSSGNGNSLRTFADFTNPTYRSDVPFATLGRTGAPNNRSLQFSPNEDLYAEGASINNRVLNQFTIEASVKFTSLDGWQTFVGKDGVGFANTDGNLASLYFQLANDDANQDKVTFKVHQADGTFIDVYTQQTVTPNVWYTLAAVLSNDGTPGDALDQTLSLYLYDPASKTYVLQQSRDFRGGMGHQDRTWTVGRGMYENNPGDFLNGFVDEVRISDAALPTTDFLAAVPEPGALGLLGIGALATLRRRRP